MKLFKVTFRNFRHVYVGANDAGEAYKKARKFWDDNGWYFTKDRELLCVELMADSSKYTDLEVHYLP